MCIGIEPKSDTTGEDKIECQLNKLRTMKNNAMEEPEDGAVDQTVASKKKDVAMKLLDFAGKMYSKRSR